MMTASELGVEKILADARLPILWGVQRTDITSGSAADEGGKETAAHFASFPPVGTPELRRRKQARASHPFSKLSLAGKSRERFLSAVDVVDAGQLRARM